MAQVGGERARELEGLLHEVAFHLSPAHVEALVAHPDAVRSALAAAADVLSMNDEERSGDETNTGNQAVHVRTEEATTRMAGQTGKGGPETLLTSEELAKRMGLKTRQSVHEWLKKGRIVGLARCPAWPCFPCGTTRRTGPTTGWTRPRDVAVRRRLRRLGLAHD